MLSKSAETATTRFVWLTAATVAVPLRRHFATLARASVRDSDRGGGAIGDLALDPFPAVQAGPLSPSAHGL
jgi:hypothetical protein